MSEPGSGSCTLLFFAKGSQQLCPEEVFVSLLVLLPVPHFLFPVLIDWLFPAVFLFLWRLFLRFSDSVLLAPSCLDLLIGSSNKAVIEFTSSLHIGVLVRLPHSVAGQLVREVFWNKGISWDPRLIAMPAWDTPCGRQHETAFLHHRLDSDNTVILFTSYFLLHLS